MSNNVERIKEKEEEKPVVAKTAVDLQRLKLQKLMKNVVGLKCQVRKAVYSNVLLIFLDYLEMIVS